MRVETLFGESEYQARFVMPPHIRAQIDDFSRAWLLEEQKKRSFTRKRGQSAERNEADFMRGKRGEWAASRSLGVPHELRESGSEIPDVRTPTGGYDVRTTDLLHGRLIVQTYDIQFQPRRRHILVCERPGWAYVVRGWIFNEDAERFGSFETHRALGGCYYVQARHLRPIVPEDPIAVRQWVVAGWYRNTIE